MEKINSNKKFGKLRLSKSFIIALLIFIWVIILIIPKEVLKNNIFTGNVLAQVRILGGQFAPTFDFNLSNYTINQSAAFILDVNCSDQEFGDVITYYDNFTGFNINSSNGMINQTSFSQSFIGNHSINITCSDGRLNTSQFFVLSILDSNDPPVLNSVGNQVATSGEQFTLTISASDNDGDNLTYGVSTTLFSIDPVSGLINFTPTLSNIGNYTINVTVFDGSLYDYEVILFSIVRGAFCGDGSCGSLESCSSCQNDCGSCPETTSPGQNIPGLGSGSSSTAISTSPQGQAPYYRCDEKWECSEWSSCQLDGVRQRKCIDINSCTTKKQKPAEIEICQYIPTCDDSILNGDEDQVDCGGSCKPCILPNCFDNIQNQNETGVDCGGSCKQCEIKKFSKPPLLELPGIIKLIPKKFPWILIIIIFFLILLALVIDQVYSRHIRKKNFDDYREKISKYRKTRNKLYKTILNTSFITLVASFYIYMFSNNFSKMLLFSWIPAAIIFLIPIFVAAIIKYYAFHEYKKAIKEAKLKETHKRELIQLIGIENKILAEDETRVKKKIFDLSVLHKFDSHVEMYKKINPIFTTLSKLISNRKIKSELSKISIDSYKLISKIIENKNLGLLVNDYPEFISIQKNLQKINNNINIDTSYIEEQFLDDINEISLPHILVVIKSNQNFIKVYNDLVDLYTYLLDKNNALQKNDNEISQIERVLTDNIKELSKSDKLLEEIKQESEIANVYNNLIDLFNHYMKKQELSSRIK